jgi:hypothetical protein
MQLFDRLQDGPLKMSRILFGILVAQTAIRN